MHPASASFRPYFSAHEPQPIGLNNVWCPHAQDWMKSRVEKLTSKSENERRKKEIQKEILGSLRSKLECALVYCFLQPPSPSSAHLLVSSSLRSLPPETPSYMPPLNTSADGAA